jgi:hypothetical protein
MKCAPEVVQPRQNVVSKSELERRVGILDKNLVKFGPSGAQIRTRGREIH